ncbi:MurR/RpiR family transcriptional regulator [Tannockella kyphosi]|uniref:MurR/RpiR family transcriptional regulator n=1 Tax=Tannockella kyphosi TaxID=2899121 RepID=UPI0020129790|nr:MurR/RpiR family transcriptional regulator [Tannockella kyphosi]
MKSLFYRLIIFLDTTSELDTNYAIAWYMAHNFQKVSTMGISQLAQECYVSAATISRFCRSLGYENFAHLKQECYTFSSQSKKFNNLIDMPFDLMKENPLETTNQYAKKVAECMQDMSRYFDWNVADRILEAIHDHENIAFFGTQFSHSAALHLQTDLLMLEKFTLAHMEPERQLECAKNLTEDSIAVVITVNGYYTNASSKILQHLKKSNAKIILITSNENVDLGIPVDYTLLIGSRKNRKMGKHTLLMAMELLSLRYYALYYPSIKDRLDDDNYTT